MPESKPKKNVVFLTVTLVILGLVGFGAWSFYNYQQAKKEVVRLSTLDGQKELQEREIGRLLSAVAKHLVLPEDEQPTVATISDIEALKENQPFFNGARNGDKVIVYTEASRAIIYSLERDVIVNVGTVFVDDNQVAAEDVSDEAVLSETDEDDSTSEE